MQKIMVALMLISITLFGGNLVFKLAGDGKGLNLLNEAFAATDATLIETTMNGWAKISSTTMTPEQLKGIIRTGSQASFGVIPSQITIYEEDNTIIAQASYACQGFLVDVSAQSLPDESFLVVTLQTNDASKSVEDAELYMKKFFQASNLKVQLTTCLVGVVQGKLTSQQAAVLLGRVLAVLNADMLESYSDGTATNVLGYSKLLPGGITFAGRKHNVSLTSRYNPNDGSTYLWLAWPTFSLPI